MTWPDPPGPCRVCGRQLDDVGTCRCLAGAPAGPSSVHDVQAGEVVWGRGRGWWRPVRVLEVVRRGARVSYYVRGPRLVEQTLPWRELRLEPPTQIYGVVDTPAPPPSRGPRAAEGGA